MSDNVINVNLNEIAKERSIHQEPNWPSNWIKKQKRKHDRWMHGGMEDELVGNGRSSPTAFSSHQPEGQLPFWS